VQAGLARAAAQATLDDGSAAERFAAMVAALGGPADLIESPGSHLPHASVTKPIAPERPGYVVGMNARAVGLVVTGLGGNRRREDDQIDYGVGLSRVAAIGTEVGPDCPLAIVHARGDSSADEAAIALRAAFRVADEPPAARHVLLGRV